MDDGLESTNPATVKPKRSSSVRRARSARAASTKSATPLSRSSRPTKRNSMRAGAASSGTAGNRERSTPEPGMRSTRLTTASRPSRVNSSWSSLFWKTTVSVAASALR